MTTLVKYEAAKHALAAAKAVDEVKKIHDVSAAMKAYARQAKDKQLEIDASEIRIRAERRLGEMIAEQKRTVGLNTGAAGSAGPGRGNAVPIENRVSMQPTLAQVGIDKKLSSRSQAIAAIPADDFENTLAEHREQQQAVTASTMEKLSKQGRMAAKTPFEAKMEIDERELTGDSYNLQQLKHFWKRANRADKKEFLRWIGTQA